MEKKVKKEAYEILDISQKIYQFQEKNNPTAIFGDKIFLISTDEKCEEIFVEQNYETEDSFYYFETNQIEGVIIKRKNGSYCIKAAVNYKDDNNQNFWYEKIRIEKSYDDIRITGKWGGSWQSLDCDDKDQIKDPDSDFFVALDSMKSHLCGIFNQLCNNDELNQEVYDPKWVKKLKHYNK